MNAVDLFLISYLVPEISTFKEPKHDTQNWLTANNNNSKNGDVIRFAYSFESIETLRTEGCQENTTEFWPSKQHYRFQAPFIQNNDS